ncbi:MAG: Amino acid transporter, permease protein region, His/Glu/Gln/Arg/opine [Ramlibacter sp.]|nr:Amino acid transporter, permease protein region, His/Glu/Gln/Arg/opine [Ramlibacter sp.]
MPAKRRRGRSNWSWRSRAFRGLVYQVLAAAAVAGLAWFLWSNTLTNMRVRGIQSGFDFLGQQAGFSIGESLFPFDSAESYWKAFAVGLANTLRVALSGIVLATFIGTVVGVGRFSRNLLVRSVCAAYVECFRNIPVLLQLLVWYHRPGAAGPGASSRRPAFPGACSGRRWPW